MVQPIDVPAAIHQLENERDLKLLIQQMSRAFRDSEGGGLMERFEAVSKLLFTKIVDEREAAGTWNGASRKRAEELVFQPGDDDRILYERARAVWQRAISTYPQVFAGARAAFPRDVRAVSRILRLLAGISLSSTASDVKGGAYEEMLRNTFEKNENQQYFTPRHVVDFMVGLCQPSETQATCDPATGSGGFLVGALTHVAARGGDVATFAAAMRGAEVDERMAWVARINMLMHGGDPLSIRHLTGAGSLAPGACIRCHLPPASFDLILTNPPFGSDMTDETALRVFTTGIGRQSRRRGVLFVERCIELLKPGGRLAIVLDDSVLNLPTNSDIQALIRERTIVEAVISLPDVTFMPYSTAKSSILIARKREGDAEEQMLVFMADVENVGNRPNGDPLYADEYDDRGQRLLKSDLPMVLELFDAFRRGELTDLRELGGTTVFATDIDRHVEEIDGKRLDVFFFHPARQEAQDQLANSRYPLLPLTELVQLDAGAVNPSQAYGDAVVRWIGLGDIEALSGRYAARDLAADRIKSSTHAFRGGDILFSRLRPKLRKAILIPDEDDGGVCSAELLVMRVRDPQEVLAPYLAYLLRSDLTYGQLIYRVTGVGRPRVNADAVRRLRIPVPPIPIQRDILEQLTTADGDALELRNEAHRNLEAAEIRMRSAYEEVIRAIA